MTALDDIFSDPDCRRRDPDERKRKLKSHHKQVGELKKAKAAEAEAAQQREKRRQEHEATRTQATKHGEAAEAELPEAQEVAQNGKRQFAAEPPALQSVLFPSQVSPPDVSLECMGAFALAACNLSEAAGMPSETFEAGLMTELILGSWIAPYCISQRRCPADVAQLLFDTELQSQDPALAAAAHRQLTNLIMASGGPSVPGISKADRPALSHPHIDLQWVPNSADFLRALSKLGCMAADAKDSTHKSRKKGLSPTRDSSSEPADLLLGNLQLLIQLFSTVCQQQAATGAALLQAKGLGDMLRCLLELSLDPSGLALMMDLEDAFQAGIAAFEEQSWAAEVTRIAQSIAAVGASHRGALLVIKHLSPHDPRISQLRQQAAAALLSSLDFCQGHKKSRATPSADMQQRIRDMPWFGDGGEGAALARRACKPDKDPVDGWALNTALESIDMMLGPMLSGMEDAVSDQPNQGLEPEFVKQFARLLQHLSTGLHRANFYDHAARATAFLASKLRERVLSALELAQ